jgi:hypothetical protein
MWLRFSLGALLGLACSWTTAATASAAASKVVRYRGYGIVVPGSWPVYDLGSHPGVCVRFNRHAVYLGRPSSSQRCPAHAVGRTEAILVEPLAARGAGARAEAGRPLSPVSNAAQPPQGSSARLLDPSAGVLVTATWDRRPGTIEHALGARSLPTARENTPGAGAASAARMPPARARAASAAGGLFTGLGFDACSAPSTSRMSAWEESPYRAVGIYIGGANMACAQPSLTAGWVSTESAAGWHLIPTYVGLQAPNNSCGCAGINPGRATAEGAAAANDAVNRALSVGIGPGNPIYFDMEAYPRGGSNTSAVLGFLAAWTSGLHNAGYESGVYSNADSGISDLVAARGTGFSEPDDIWIADWNGQHTTASPYVPGGEWGNHQRLHQYAGGHNATYGGVTLNIDSNFLDGATAGASSAGASAAIPDGTFVQVEGSEAIHEVAGGAPLNVSPQYWSSLGTQAVTQISLKQFALLNPVPADGTLLEDSTGSLYRVAGGAPLFVSEPGLFAGVQPVTVDHWNISNIGDPLAHLNPVPAKGTFLTTTTGQIYRVAGGAPFALSRWSLFGGVRPSVTIDQWDLANLSSPSAHLNAKPFEGTLVEGLPSRTYWVFAGGRRRLTSARAAAVQVDDAGLAAFAAIPCQVPRLKQLTLPQVRRVLQAADCRLGRVQRRVRREPSALHVVNQAPRPRTTRTASSAVEITLG